MTFAEQLDRWAEVGPSTMEGPAKRAKRLRKKAKRKAAKGKGQKAAKIAHKAEKVQGKADRRLIKKSAKRAGRKGLPKRTATSLATIDEQAQAADALAEQDGEAIDKSAELEDLGTDEAGPLERYAWPIAGGIVASAIALRFYMRRPAARRGRR